MESSTATATLSLRAVVAAVVLVAAVLAMLLLAATQQVAVASPASGTTISQAAVGPDCCGRGYP